MSQCAQCALRVCRSEARWQECAVSEGAWKEATLERYQDPGVQELARMAAHVEKTGYLRWTRLQETAEFALRSGFTRVGLAFCSGLSLEARQVARYYQHRGLAVSSAICALGSISKDLLSIPESDRLNPGYFEVMCNPVGQAVMMNEARTQWNVVLGLCVGHDSLFFKNSEAPVTVLATKDRVLGHNPLAAVYCAESYYRRLYQD